jgi:hypothetical protein
MPKGLKVVKSTDVANGQPGAIALYVKLRKLRHMQVKRKAFHAVCFAVEVTHAPARYINAFGPAQKPRENGAEQKLEPAIAA